MYENLLYLRNWQNSQDSLLSSKNISDFDKSAALAEILAYTSFILFFDLPKSS